MNDLKNWFVTVQYRTAKGNCLEKSEAIKAITGLIAIDQLKSKIQKRKSFLKFGASKATLMDPIQF